jgi:PII-like signaling protein
VIELVDTEEKIRAFLPDVEQMIEISGCGAMITLEKAEIIRYSHGK